MYVCFGAFAAMSIDLAKWSQLFNGYGASRTHASEPWPLCQSTCPSGHSCSTFTAYHVHIIRSRRCPAHRRVQVLVFVQRLRRCHVYTLQGHRGQVHPLAQVLGVAQDATVSFIHSRVPSPPWPSACPSGQRCATGTACHVHMLRSHRLHVYRLAQVVAVVQRLRRVMYTFLVPSAPCPSACPSGR